jgi:hypothetical protein
MQHLLDALAHHHDHAFDKMYDHRRAQREWQSIANDSTQPTAQREMARILADWMDAYKEADLRAQRQLGLLIASISDSK